MVLKRDYHRKNSSRRTGKESVLKFKKTNKIAPQIPVTSGNK